MKHFALFGLILGLALFITALVNHPLQPPTTFVDEHGTTWELILDNKSLNQKLCAQTSGYGKRIVYRDDAAADCWTPQSSVMHELMHVCQWNAGIQANDEMTVHRVIYMEAPCLYSIERSNPRLATWLSR